MVIKLLHDFWASEDWMRERFRGEAAVLARLDHPGIVGLIDAAEAEDGRLFLVFPFHEGRSLREALTAGQPIRFAASASRPFPPRAHNGIEKVLVEEANENVKPAQLDRGFFCAGGSSTSSGPPRRPSVASPSPHGSRHTGSAGVLLPFTQDGIRAAHRTSENVADGSQAAHRIRTPDVLLGLYWSGAPTDQ